MVCGVAILGAGIGREHLAAYLALPQHFQVHWICDVNLERAEELAARAPGCSTAAGIDQVLQDPRVDLVDVCLPPHLHADASLAAIAAGKHVVCEKPLAGSIVDAERVRDAALSADRLVVPVFQYRYGQALAELRILQAAGLTGPPRVATLETHWNRGADYYAVPWRGTWAHELGGAILSHALHIHDLCCVALGDVADVSAFVATAINPIETEDCAAIALRLQNGALVTSSITLGAADDTSRLRLVFADLTVESGRAPYAPAAAAWSFKARDPARQVEVDARLAACRAGRPVPSGFHGLFLALAQALDGGDRATLPSPDDGVRSIELATGIYTAARTGARVRLPLDRALPICRSLASGSMG